MDGRVNKKDYWTVPTFFFGLGIVGILAALYLDDYRFAAAGVGSLVVSAAIGTSNAISHRNKSGRIMKRAERRERELGAHAP